MEETRHIIIATFQQIPRLNYKKHYFVMNTRSKIASPDVIPLSLASYRCPPRCAFSWYSMGSLSSG
jgi:hypothetical protein